MEPVSVIPGPQTATDDLWETLPSGIGAVHDPLPVAATGCAGCLPVAGRTPYGYRRRIEGASSMIEPDPATAPVVRRIFAEYVAGRGLLAIAERLTADGILRPAAYDHGRNPHHVGSAWSSSAVRAVVTNDRYAAPSGCEHGCERGALIPADAYRQAVEMLRQRGVVVRAYWSRGRANGSADRYLLRGMLRCELCRRLMQGSWNNDAAYYRCRVPKEYARANGMSHPANVYVRESRLLEALGEWLAGSLPEHRRVAVRAPAGSAGVLAALHAQLMYDCSRNVVRIRLQLPDGRVVAHDLSL